MPSLVGSEMCIRDSFLASRGVPGEPPGAPGARRGRPEALLRRSGDALGTLLGATRRPDRVPGTILGALGTLRDRFSIDFWIDFRVGFRMDFASELASEWHASLLSGYSGKREEASISDRHTLRSRDASGMCLVAIGRYPRPETGGLLRFSWRLLGNCLWLRWGRALRLDISDGEGLSGWISPAVRSGRWSALPERT